MSQTVRGCFALLSILVMFTPALAVDGAVPIPFMSPVTTPITITAGGSYVLTGTLAPTGPGPLIDVATPEDVVLDLNGFTLDNSANPGDPVILISGGPAAEVVIRNGAVMGGGAGILVSAGAAEVVIERVKVSDTGVGISLFSVTSFSVRDSVVLRTTANAILAGSDIVKQGTIADNLIQFSGGGIGVRKGSSVAILNNRLERIFPSPIPIGPPYVGSVSGGIILVGSDDCLVSNNTIEEVSGPEGKGIRVINTHGSKFYNNVIMKVHDEGMLFDAAAFDDLILNNVVVHAGWDGVAPSLPFDGIRVMGAPVTKGHHIDRNVLNRSGGHGLHFALGATDSNFGRNTGVGNTGIDPCPGGGHPAGPSLDFCDENGIIGAPGADNFSFGDNLMPGRLGLF